MNSIRIFKIIKQSFIKTKQPPHSYNPAVLEEIRKIIIIHASNNEIEKIFLFGSRAKGKNTKTSDYDIGIVAKRALDRQTLLAITADIKKALITPCHIIDINQKPEDFKTIAHSKHAIDIL